MVLLACVHGRRVVIWPAAYYNGFNKSLASYGHILRHMSSSKESVRIIRAQLADVKASLHIRSKVRKMQHRILFSAILHSQFTPVSLTLTQELRKLWLRKTEYNETLRILDEMYAFHASHHIDPLEFMEKVSSQRRD